MSRHYNFLTQNPGKTIAALNQEVTDNETAIQELSGRVQSNETPNITNDYDVNKLGEVRNITADVNLNILDLEFSNKYPWTNVLKETWNTTLGDVGTPCIDVNGMEEYPQERRGAEIGGEIFSRHARNIVTKNSYFVSTPNANIVEIDTEQYPNKKGYINFLECLNRTSVRAKIPYGTGSETYADHPESVINYIGLSKESGSSMNLSDDKKVLYVHGGVEDVKTDGTPDLELISQFSNFTNDTKLYFTYIIAFELDENEELVKQSNGLVADPLIVQRIDKHLMTDSFDVISTYGTRDYAIKRDIINNKDILCFFTLWDSSTIVYKLEFNRVNNVITYNNELNYSYLTKYNGEDIEDSNRGWEIHYCNITDRFILNVRYTNGGQSENHLLLAMDANFKTGDSYVGKIKLHNIENDVDTYASQLLQEVGGQDTLGKTWMRHSGFFNSSKFFIYNGKIFYFLNVLRIIDTDFGLNDESNLSKISYVSEYKNPETLRSIITYGFSGYKADTTNNVVMLSLQTGGFDEITTLNSRFIGEAGDIGNESRSATITIIIPFSELQKTDAKTWNINVVADRITYTENMYMTATCFDNYGNAYNSGGYNQNSIDGGYSFGLLRPLIEDDNGSMIDYVIPDQQIYYSNVDYSKKYYNYIWNTRPNAINSMFNIYFFRTQVLGLETNINLNSKLTEDGLNISNNINNINVDYGVNGLDMNYNGKVPISVKQSDDAILHLTSKNRNTLVGSNLMRSADTRFANNHKNNIMIGSGLGNVPECENNILIGNNNMNFGTIKDTLIIGNDNNAVLVGDLSKGTLQLPEKSFELAKSTYNNRQVYKEIPNLNNIYQSFGLISAYGSNKFNMPREVISSLNKIEDKINEIISTVNLEISGNIANIYLAPQSILKNDVKILLDNTYDDYGDEVIIEILTNNINNIITIADKSLQQNSVPTLNPYSLEGSTPITTTPDGDSLIYEFPIELDENNLSFFYIIDTFRDQSSYTNILIDDKFKLIDTPYPKPYLSDLKIYPIPFFIENKSNENQFTVAMLRVIDINDNRGVGAKKIRNITTACELTNGNDDKLGVKDPDSFLYKINNNVDFNFSVDNDGGFGNLLHKLVANCETTNEDGSKSKWVPMVLDCAIKEWFKPDETYPETPFKKGHMFNIAECVDKDSVKIYKADTNEEVTGVEVLFAPYIEGEIGPDAASVDRINQTIFTNDGSFWTDNGITINKTQITQEQLDLLLLPSYPESDDYGDYYSEYVVYNPLLMLFKLPDNVAGGEVRMDIDLTKYGLRKEHIDMRFTTIII